MRASLIEEVEASVTSFGTGFCRTRRWTACVCVAGIAFGIIGCGTKSKEARQTPETASNVVATVEGAPITGTSLREEWGKAIRGRTTAAEVKVARDVALEGLIRTEAIYAQAKASGFDQTPEMQSRIKAMVVAQFKERQWKPSLTTVDPGEIKAYYDSHKGEYATPAMVRGSVIYISAPSKADAEREARARQDAESVLELARGAAAVQDYKAVVSKYSSDPGTRYSGGDTGWLVPGSDIVNPEIVDALSKLPKQGLFAPLVRTSNHWCIVKLLDLKGPATKSLAEVGESIRTKILHRRKAGEEIEFSNRMVAGLKVFINKAELDAVSPPVNLMDPPESPGRERGVQPVGVKPVHQQSSSDRAGPAADSLGGQQTASRDALTGGVAKAGSAVSGQTSRFVPRSFLPTSDL